MNMIMLLLEYVNQKEKLVAYLCISIHEYNWQW